jgi:hypothetical protein
VDRRSGQRHPGNDVAGTGSLDSEEIAHGRIVGGSGSVRRIETKART